MTTSSTAEEVQGGRLVVARVAERAVVGIKALRLGKDFINHYFIPLDPLPEGDLTMVYLDYSEPVEDCHARFTLHLDPIADRSAPAIGQVLANASGYFLKVQEPYKGSMSLGYVHLASGEVRRRQEHGITGVYAWRLAAVG